jgi:MFS family permease
MSNSTHNTGKNVSLAFRIAARDNEYPIHLPRFPTMSKGLRVFALFACGYFISYVYRGINIEFAPFMARDIGLSTADLGVLTSLYFLGFAGAQLPAGVLLDHFGARRVAALLLLVAGAGAAVFGMAHNLGTLMLGRLLIGIGVSVCLGGAFKALAQWFPVQRLPLLNGLVMAVGGFGGVVVGSPLNWLLSFTDWRVICFGLTVVTVLTSASIWFGVPDTANTHRQASSSNCAGWVTCYAVLRSGKFPRCRAWRKARSTVCNRCGWRRICVTLLASLRTPRRRWSRSWHLR